MRDYKQEFEKRVAFIKDILKESHASGIVFGNSGGKDCALVGILCKAACENTVGIILPCSSKRNYEEDTKDALAVANKFNIKTETLDVTPIKTALLNELEKIATPNSVALTNIAPRLRMTSLYAYAASNNMLVAGTGNRSEVYVGYFTKWGDGGHDFNPIFDLTVTEVYEFLEYLGAPEVIIKKAPSAGLFEGQTDEDDMGVKYSDIDNYLLYGKGEPEIIEKIENMHRRTEHKRVEIKRYK